MENEKCYQIINRKKVIKTSGFQNCVFFFKYFSLILNYGWMDGWMCCSAGFDIVEKNQLYHLNHSAAIRRP